MSEFQNQSEVLKGYAAQEKAIKDLAESFKGWSIADMGRFCEQIKNMPGVDKIMLESQMSVLMTLVEEYRGNYFDKESDRLENR